MNSSPQRFTIDGSDLLEAHLVSVCQCVVEDLKTLLPSSKFEALVLAGGYGRGEGGVLRTGRRDEPYNDLEFYVFLRGTPWVNARRYDRRLQNVGEKLSRKAGLHVEFKIDSLAALRRRSISMFSYDLVSRHRALLGGPQVFAGCQHHLEATTLPAGEATRLLLNRCTGLLLAKLMLADYAAPDADQADFITRNLAKLRLGLGDAVLTALGQYHWSCLERHRRLQSLTGPDLPPEFENIRNGYARGVEFKLHPRKQTQSREALSREIQDLSQSAFGLWVWLESRRLGRHFASAREYALSRLEKCRGTNKWHNYLLNLRTFGPKALLTPGFDRYPRERLFNTLPLLLWYEQASHEPDVRHRVQEQLMTQEQEWRGWLAAYKQLWPGYG